MMEKPVELVHGCIGIQVEQCLSNLLNVVVV
jgi:hypothetical protein